MENNKLPREDRCRRCGCHLGWILSERGALFAVGFCGRSACEGVEADSSAILRGREKSEEL